MDDIKRIPVTIITGALGSGKTTFVNHVLTSDHGLKIGVIVNEFGEIGIDGKLIVSSEENLVELANGCVCCEVRDDLVEATKQLLETNKIDYLLVETSGLAEVVPVAATFTLGELIDITDLDSIICLVDSENYFEARKQFLSTIEQIQCSDIILLNKTDLVSKEQIADVKEDIEKHLPSAQIIKTTKSKAPLKLLLGVGKFDLERQAGWQEKHTHEKDVQAISITTGAVDSDKVQEFLDDLPKNIFRAKGILCLPESEPGAGDELRITFQKVGKRTELEFSRPWHDGEEKQTQIVFIGKNLDRDFLQQGLDACHVQHNS